MKRLFFTLLFSATLLLFTIHLDAQTQKRPKIALVLSGGGAKGFAHIGALKVIEESGIPIDLIVGNSMGSVVGSMYAVGYTASEIEQFAHTTNWEKLFSDEVQRSYLSPDLKQQQQRYFVSIPVDENKKPVIPFSVIKGQGVLNLLCGLMANIPDSADFSKFPIPFICIGADISTGKEIVIKNGYLPTAIYSSMSIPGVFLPEEHNGNLMVDGGIVNNFPVDIAKQMGADIIIGVDIRNELHDKADIKSMKQLMDQLMNFYTMDKDTAIKKYCDILIRPDINGYSASSFYPEAVDTLIKRGTVAAQKVLPQIEKVKKTYGLSTPYHTSRELIDNHKWFITDIELTGNYSVTDNLIISKMDLLLPGIYSYDEIKASIDKVYGLGCFSKVYFKLKGSGRDKTLQLILREESVMNLNAGMRANTTDAVSLLLNYTQKDYRRYIGYFSITADISSNPGVDFQAEISRDKMPTLGVRIAAKKKSYDLYRGEDKVGNASMYYGLGKLFTYKTFGRYSLVGIGYSGELYKGDIVSSYTDSLTKATEKTTYLSSIYAYLSKDNLDDYYFPKKGMEMYLEGGIFDDEGLNNINPYILLKMRNYIPIHKKVSLLLNFHSRAIFTPTYPIVKSNYIGGYEYELFFNNHLPFYGVPPIAVTERYTAIALTGVRFKVAPHHYLSCMGNVLAQNEDVLLPEETKLIYGAGITYAYRTLLGPLEFTTAFSGEYKTPVFSINFGLWF